MLARQSAPRSEKTLSPAFLIPAFEFFGKSNSRDVGGYALTSLHMSRALRSDNSVSTRSASADASEQETVHTGSAGTKRASGVQADYFHHRGHQEAPHRIFGGRRGR